MSAKGYLSRLGIGKETTFGTAVAITQLLPFTSEGLSREIQRLEDGILGSDSRILAEQTQKSVSGSIETDLTFTGFDDIYEAALGLKSGTGVSTDPYVFSLADDINTSLTIAIDKGVSIHEYAGCKINSLTIAGDGTKLTASIDILGKTYSIPSSVNTATEFDNALDYGNRVLFADIKFSAGGIAYGISSFNLQLNNNLTAIFENSREAAEISRNGKREVSFSFELPRYQVDDFNAMFDNDTEFDVLIEAVLGTNTLQIILPRVVISNTNPVVSGAEIIKQSVECTVLKPATGDELTIKRWA